MCSIQLAPAFPGAEPPRIRRQRLATGGGARTGMCACVCVRLPAPAELC